jgi:hypothetical protein
MWKKDRNRLAGFCYADYGLSSHTQQLPSTYTMKNIVQPPIHPTALRTHEQWLQEWNAFLWSIDHVVATKEEKPSWTFPENTDPNAFTDGSILQLSPELVPNANRHYHVAILGEWGGEEGKLMVVPFSPVSMPALSTEYRVTNSGGNDEHRVLEVWNMRIMTPESLKKSVVAGKLSSEDVDAALEVWLASTTGSILPAHIAVLTGGVPCKDAGDKRVVYQTMETEMLGSELGN